MNKTVLVAILVLIVLGGGVYVYTQQVSKAPDAMMENDTAMHDEDDAMMEDDKMAMEGDSMMGESMEDGRYLEYSQDAFDRTDNTKRVLFFYANWCPTCRPADADFTKNMNQIPDDVTVLRVNYNDDQTSEEEKALATAYDVTYQHTFVQIDSDGNVITSWNGGQTDDLLKNIK